MKTSLPYRDALAVAEELLGALRTACQRIEIAGSIRRKKELIGDIELVCIPKIIPGQPDLFGQPIGDRSVLDERLGTLMALSPRWCTVKNGPHFKQFDLGQICLDLFITTRAQWGVIYAIRTGSADFSHWLVTPRKYNGGCPSNMRVKDGRVWNGEQALETPEEQDVFAALGVEWIEPENRIEKGTVMA